MAANLPRDIDQASGRDVKNSFDSAAELAKQSKWVQMCRNLVPMQVKLWQRQTRR